MYGRGIRDEKTLFIHPASFATLKDRILNLNFRNLNRLVNLFRFIINFQIIFMHIIPEFLNLLIQ
jgi:hypothetical protein